MFCDIRFELLGSFSAVEETVHYYSIDANSGEINLLTRNLERLVAATHGEVNKLCQRCSFIILLNEEASAYQIVLCTEVVG